MHICNDFACLQHNVHAGIYTKLLCMCAHLAFHICCQQYVPCSNVSVDETFLGEVMHGTSDLLTESQQLLWQLPAVRCNRPSKTQKCNTY